MNLPRKMPVFRTIAGLLGCVFLYQQAAWAGDLIDIVSQKQDIEQTNNFAPAYLQNRSSVQDNIISVKQASEDLNNIPTSTTKDKGNTKDESKITLQGPPSAGSPVLIQPLSTTANPSATYSYYKDGRMSSETLSSPDSLGNIYYHYLDENWKKQGYGRIDIEKRQTPDSEGAIAYKLTYASGTNRVIKRKYYSDFAMKNLMFTKSYYNDTSNRLESLTLIAPDLFGNTYYHYLNENWNTRGYGRIDKSVMSTSVNGQVMTKAGKPVYLAELSYTYTYYSDSTGRLKTKNAYSDSKWKKLIATYTYFNDDTNRLASKQDIPESTTYTFYNDSTNYIESKVVSGFDVYGYDHYMNEDWNGRGYGRIDKSREGGMRPIYLINEHSYAYTYYDDHPDRIKTKNAYSDSNWTKLIAVYAYYDDDTNRVASKVDKTTGITYTFYNDDKGRVQSETYSAADRQTTTDYFLNEDWNNRGYGRLSKSTTQGGSSSTYNYYNDPQGRLQTVNAYSDDNWALLSATYDFEDDWQNSLITKRDPNAGIFYTYYEDSLIKSETFRSNYNIPSMPRGSATYRLYYRDENWDNQGFGRVSRESIPEFNFTESYAYGDKTGCPRVIWDYGDGMLLSRVVRGNKVDKKNWDVLYGQEGVPLFYRAYKGTSYLYTYTYSPDGINVSVTTQGGMNVVGGTFEDFFVLQNIKQGNEFKQQVSDANNSKTPFPNGFDPWHALIDKLNISGYLSDIADLQQQSLFLNLLNTASLIGNESLDNPDIVEALFDTVCKVSGELLSHTPIDPNDYTPEEKKQVLTVLLLPGINNPNPLRVPPGYMNGFATQLDNVAPGAVNKVFITGYYKSLPGVMGPFVDSASWIRNSIFRTDEITDDIYSQLQAKFGNSLPPNTAAFAYSGDVAPLVQMLNKHPDLDVKGIVLVGGPLVVGTQIANDHVNNVVMIQGDKDRVPNILGVFSTGFPSLGNNINPYYIRLKGINHLDYSYDPANPNPSLESVEAAWFCSYMTTIVNNKETINKFLYRDEGVTYNPDSGTYDVDLKKVLYGK